MAATIEIPAGGYRYIPYAFQYSGGVEALAGHQIERVEFARPLPLAAGFAWIEQYLGRQGVPLVGLLCLRAALAGAVHRSRLHRVQPSVHRDAAALGRDEERQTTTRWRAATSSRRCTSRPNRASTRSASPARPTARRARSSSPAAARQATVPAPYRERIVRYGDTSPDAMRDKAVFVLGRMEERMAVLGKTWADTTATQVYAVHDLHSYLADEIVQRGAAQHGLIWHFARPPVEGLEYEMDCRSVPVEHHVEV